MLRVRIIAALCYLPCSLTKDPALAGFFVNDATIFLHS
ncbi:hypothetical protein F976_03611, partial [Acinetobacter baumannii NIPH 1734]